MEFVFTSLLGLNSLLLKNSMQARDPEHCTDKPFHYHDELTVDIQSLSNEGRGIARIDNWIVMVPFVIPGERVRVRIFKNHTNYSEADLIEVLQASPDRISPPCPLFGQCGGCQYQHMAYEKQLEWKHRHVTDCLERIAKLSTKVKSVQPSQKIYGYRTKITPHFERNCTHNFPIGFLAYGRKRLLVDVLQCYIASAPINTCLPEVRIQTRQNLQMKSGTLLLRDCSQGVLTNPRAVACAQVCAYDFLFPAGSFFQNNPYILESISQYLQQLRLQFGQIHYLVDAYCGVGVFGIILAKSMRQFVGIEVDEPSIALAQKNMQLNHVDNGRMQHGEAEAIFKGIAFPKDQTLVVVDPPRKGCSENFLQQLIQFQPAVMVYISCAPDTQARDLKRVLTLAPQYKILELQAFDMFPQTKHLECVAVLSRM
ncbi:MAG: class I SAM-dependent RNA methyltransferase [Puniceicoccales bacterium]|jgi:23S rRNA (uracil1939-C5)-methyltransferase/tRNA (uracil-5-)-methyltransferase|nr:class I SAM-dependent RNA methyltransferase [Puniceicoccales bacterium]